MSCSLEIRLKPGAKRNQIAIGDSGNVEVSVTSPPLENKANEHLIRLLADKLNLPKSSLRIIRGGHCRNKVVSVDNLTMEESLKRLHQ